MNLHLQPDFMPRAAQARRLLLASFTRYGRRNAFQSVRMSLLAGVLMALLVQLGALPARAQEPTPVDAPAGGAVVNHAAFAAAVDPALPAWTPGELLVGVEDPSALAAAVQHAGMQNEVTIASVMSAAAADGSAPTRTTQIVQVPVGQELAMANLLATQPGIRYVEPNAFAYAAQDDPAAKDGEGTVEAALVPPGFVVDDTFYATRQWNMQRVDAARAWQLALTAGIFAAPSNQIIVAVVDSGVDRAHPEFAGRLLEGKNYIECTFDELRYPVFDQDGYQLCNEPVIDDFGHGTHVAGIVAAATNDDQGVAGIAPMIQIDPRRVLAGPFGNGSVANVALAIREAADDGAHVINLSLVVRDHYITLEEAVEYATSKGALVVAAAGNNNVDQVYWPAAYPEAVSVAALDYYDQPASYSNRGPENDIAAPGGTLQIPVFSAWPQPSSFPIGPNGQPQTRCSSGLVQDGEGHYCTNYGTSFAAPAVAGAAALLFALDPALTATEVRQLLQAGAKPLPFTVEQVGAGKLNVANAVRALVAPSLQLTASGMFSEVLSTAQPFSYTVRLDNPSTQPISWTATLELNTRPKVAENNQPFGVDRIWITMTETLSNTEQGTTAFNDPDVLAFTIDPRNLPSGIYSSRLHMRISTPRAGTTPLLVQESVDITIQVNERSERIWMPILLHQIASGHSAVPYVAYRWETPARLADRLIHDFTIAPPISQTYGITSVESLTLTLPSAVRVQGESFTTMRLHADGFVSFPETSAPFGFTPGINECLASPRWQAAVYGWWADLDANAPGAQVSSFPLADGRYVIEYSNVPTSALAFPVVEPYTVSFQIVLSADGSVGLNYADVPPFDGEEPYATVGVEVVDGLFYSEIACSTPAAVFGVLPQAGESFVIRARDIF